MLGQWDPRHLRQPTVEPLPMYAVLGNLSSPDCGGELHRRLLRGEKGPGPTPVGLRAAPSPWVQASASLLPTPPHSRLPSRCPRLPRGRRATGGGGRSGLNRGSPDLARWDVTNRRRPTLRAEQSRRPPELESAAGEPGADQPQTQSCLGTVRDAGLGRGVSQA